MDEEDMESLDAPTVTLQDEAGRSINCYVEQSLEVEGEEYVLLLPVDSPVEIFVWQEGEDEDDEEAVLVEDDAQIDVLFPVAQAVLQEQNLTLKRTAVALTVEGDLPELVEDEEADEAADEEHEELQLLASFYHEEQEYAIYTPLDPLFILARINEAGQPTLLTPAEFEKIEPMLPMIEDQLFDEME